jgi:pilus assembly protein CpaE
VACHTAVELGRQGKQQVLLADLDLNAGLVRFLLKSKSPYSFLDATNNLHRLDVSYWKALISNGYPGLEVIAAPEAFYLGSEPRPEQIRQVLRFARSHYGWTIVDLGRSLGPLTMAAFEEMDEACVVTTLDVPALHQCKQMVRTLLESGYGSHRLRLVSNRTPKRLEITPEELEKMLGLPVYLMLPEDPQALSEAYGEGKLLPAGSQLGRHIARLSVKISGEPEEKGRRRFSLFG